MPSQLLWPAIKQAAASGVLAGGYGYAKNNWYVGANAPIFGRRVDSIEALLAIAEPGDIAFLGPQEYSEGNLVIPATLSPFTMIGMGNRGSSFIEPSTTTMEGLQVLADDVTLMNVGIAKGATGDYALSVGSQAVSADRFRAYGCKIEGDGVAALLYGAGDVLLEDCEFCWCGTGIQFRSNDIGFNTQIYIRRCRFHDVLTACLGHFAAAQQVNGLNVEDSVFERDESGTPPVDYIMLSDNLNTGYFAGNRFAFATNEADTLAIGTGILWGPNGTEAGWSTARPS